MKRYRSVALIGAGAIGSYFIAGFARCEGVSFCVIAEGERRERLMRDGVVINGETFRPAVKTPEEARGVDLLLVSVKYTVLRDVLDMIATVVGENTDVLSLLNGVDSELIIGHRVGDGHIVYSVTLVRSENRGGKIFFYKEKDLGILIGEASVDRSVDEVRSVAEPSERIRAIDALMKQAGLTCRVSDDIVRDQWRKFSLNVVYNLPQAVLGVGYGAYFESPYVKAIRDCMFGEVCKVAGAEGIPIDADVEKHRDFRDAAHFSTLQDLEAHRKTEVGMFVGMLMRLAAKHGVEIPFCEFSYLAIRALEEKGEGRFAYDG